jgi:hypothetical protein
MIETAACRHLGRIKSTRTAAGLPDLTVWQCEAQAIGCVPLVGDLERLPGMKAAACEGCPLFVAGGTRMSPIERVVSFGKTMAKTGIRKLRTGEALASLEVIQERAAICGACSHNVGGICDLCDCSTVGGRVLSNKLAHASAECQDKPPRWRAVK